MTLEPDDLIIEPFAAQPSPQRGGYRVLLNGLALQCRTRAFAEATALTLAHRAGVAVFLRDPRRGLLVVGTHRQRRTH